MPSARGFCVRGGALPATTGGHGAKEYPLTACVLFAALIRARFDSDTDWRALRIHTLAADILLDGLKLENLVQGTACTVDYLLLNEKINLGNSTVVLSTVSIAASPCTS